MTCHVEIHLVQPRMPAWTCITVKGATSYIDPSAEDVIDSNVYYITYGSRNIRQVRGALMIRIELAPCSLLPFLGRPQRSGKKRSTHREEDGM